MVLSLFILQIQTAAEFHVPSSESVLTSGVDDLSDQKADEFIIADIDENFPVRVYAPHDFDVYRYSNYGTAPHTALLSVKTAAKGIVLKDSIQLILRI
jgi:hypothetical protein